MKKVKVTPTFKKIFITGCGRGIGLELVRQLLEKKSDSIEKIFASVRNESEELNKVHQKFPSKLHIVKLDITKAESVKECFEEIKKQTEFLNLIINNSGVLPKGGGSASEVKSEDMLHAFNTNVVGTMLVTNTFLPLFPEHPKPFVVNISTVMSSISGNTGGTCTAYRVSKTALNMLTKNYSVELREKASFVLETLFWLMEANSLIINLFCKGQCIQDGLRLTWVEREHLSQRKRE